MTNNRAAKRQRQPAPPMKVTVNWTTGPRTAAWDALWDPIFSDVLPKLEVHQDKVPLESPLKTPAVDRFDLET